MKALFDQRAELGRDVYSFYFKNIPNFSFMAGQYVYFTFLNGRSDLEEYNRWFTIFASPTEDYIAFTTRITTRHSDFKEELLKLKKGQEVLISEPLGDFVLPIDKQIPLIFIAGGIGMTPVRSIVKYLIDKKEKRTIKVIQFAKSEAEVYFSDVIDEYKLDHQVFISGQTRPDNKIIIYETDKKYPEALYFVSGPQPLVEDFADIVSNNLGEDRVIMDYFPGYDSI